jgi:hypothetical protein
MVVAILAVITLLVAYHPRSEDPLGLVAPVASDTGHADGLSVMIGSPMITGLP